MPYSTKVNALSNHASVLIAFLLCLVLAATLVNSNAFIYPSMSAYFLYTGTVALFMVITAVFLYRKQISLTVSLPSLLFYLLVGCSFISAWLFTGFISQQHRYLLVCGLFLLGASAMFDRPDLRFHYLFTGITALSIAESVYCLLQYAGLAGSLNNYFKVAGTASNPNVTAMFLAMAWPPVFFYTLTRKLIQRNIWLATLVLITIALLLLKCRTAYLGIGISSLLLLKYRYKSLSTVFIRKNLTGIIAGSVILFSLLLQLSNTVYQSKKASANGRMLVWKISLNMIQQSPLTGFGYGNFEQQYNLFQSAYFNENKASPAEKQNAAFVRMAYNEFLERTIEGGIPALLLFGGMLLSLLVTDLKPQAKPKTNPIVQPQWIIAYSGIASFTGMCLVNFTVQAIPVMAMALLYIAILSLHPNIWFKYKVSRIRVISAVVLAFGGILLVYQLATDITANYRNKQAAGMLRSGQYRSAGIILKNLHPALHNSASYWKNTGQYYLVSHNFPQAISAYNRAKLFSSDPEIYTMAGLCYQQTGNYRQAAANYQIAKNIEPGRMIYRVALMELYLKAKNFAAARVMALEIIAMQPKISSEKAKRYQLRARNVLHRLGTPAQPGAVSVQHPVQIHTRNGY